MLPNSHKVQLSVLECTMGYKQIKMLMTQNKSQLSPDIFQATLSNEIYLTKVYPRVQIHQAGRY